MKKLFLFLILVVTLGMSVANATPSEPRLQAAKFDPDFNPEEFLPFSAPAVVKSSETNQPHKAGWMLADLFLKPVATAASTLPGIGGLVGFAATAVIEVGNRIVNPSGRPAQKAE